MPRTLISTIFKGEATEAAIIKFSPDKIILIGVDKSDPKRKTELKKNINKLKNKYKAINFEVLDTSVYDIPKIVNDTCKAIDKEYKLRNEILIHMSEGRKTQALSAMFAGFTKKEKIKGIYYLIQETGKALPMPMLNFKVSPTKRKILEEISRGTKKVSIIIKKTKKSKAMIYAHLKELKKDGYVTDKLELNDSGKIVIL